MSDELDREEFKNEQKRWIDEENLRERARQAAPIEWAKMPEQVRNNDAGYLPVLPNGDVDLRAFTCFECALNDSCEFRWDHYNTHGDCLLLK